MQPSAIVFPAIAMFFLTSGMIGLLAIRRLTAVRRGEISLAYFKLYNLGMQPDALQQIGRHVQNHFEVPPLFYVVVLFLDVRRAARRTLADPSRLQRRQPALHGVRREPLRADGPVARAALRAALRRRDERGRVAPERAAA
jgi:hypothetical protein